MKNWRERAINWPSAFFSGTNQVGTRRSTSQSSSASNNSIAHTRTKLWEREPAEADQGGRGAVGLAKHDFCATPFAGSNSLGKVAVPVSIENGAEDNSPIR